MNIIVKTIFGSDLYGTKTENSDTDYKGVYLPGKKEILLGKFPKAINKSTNGSSKKNTKDDEDIEIFSLHEFIKLACEGQTLAIDMLFTPKELIIESSDIWESIVENRNKFISKNLKSFVGYARSQASRYGIKGSRMEESKNVLVYLNMMKELHGGNIKVRDLWDTLPVGEHIHKKNATTEHNNVRMYQVCGRFIQENTSVNHAIGIVENFCNKYGKRTEMAKNSKGIDWKAISHAIRAAIEVKELLTTGKIVFPLKDANFLTDVKTGKLDYKTEVGLRLEKEMEEVEKLIISSDIPELVDTKYWDDFIVHKIEKIYFQKEV